jgi:polar amino acid transport system ATP-binding protein
MLVVTHEMGFARNVGSRVAFMDHGEIIETAPPAAFFHSPRTERARRFLQQFED